MKKRKLGYQNIESRKGKQEIMWGLITTIFLAFYCLICFYIGRRGWTTIGKSNTRIYKRIYWLLFGILIFSFPLIEFAEDYLSGTAGLWLTTWGWYSMLTVVYIFLLLLFIDLIILIDKRFNFVPLHIKTHKRTKKIITFCFLALVTLSLVYGTWNARTPTVTNYELAIDKKAGPLNELTVALVADIHYGEVINHKRLDRMAEIMNELNPDLMLIAGDIIEGIPDQENADEFLNAFKSINPQYGKIAVAGNHDRWLRSEEGVLRFQEAGIYVLRDEVLKIQDSFYVIGRDDPGHGRGRERKELVNLIDGLNTSLPIILLDHQPSDLENAQRNHVDLQLSGHTHMGQIFPANFITGQIYELDWGILTKASYHLIVTCGYGTWGPPLRIGTQPEIVHITLKFNQ